MKPVRISNGFLFYIIKNRLPFPGAYKGLIIK